MSNNTQILYCVEGSAGTCRNADLIEQLRADLAAAREQLEIARAATNAELRKHDKGPTTDEQRRQEYLFILSCLGYDFEAEAGKLRADLAATRVALEAVEWVGLFAGTDMGGEDTCPWCDQLSTVGHAPDCARQVALGLGGKP